MNVPLMPQPGAAALVRDRAAVRLLTRRRGAGPWLPQPKDGRELTVSAEMADGGSRLSLYREALRIRRPVPVFAAAPLSWRQAPGGLLPPGTTAWLSAG
jgi:hypothetical protein